MWKISDAFLAFAVIALIIGIVLMFSFSLKDDDERTETDNHNLSRASLFLLATVALGVLVLVFQRYEAEHLLKSMM